MIKVLYGLNAQKRQIVKQKADCLFHDLRGWKSEWKKPEAKKKEHCIMYILHICTVKITFLTLFQTGG